MIIIRNRTYFFAISFLAVALSIGALFGFGLQIGTDFTGGSLVEIRYDGQRPLTSDISANLTDAGFENFSVRESGEDSVTLRAEILSDSQRENLPAVLSWQGGTAVIEQLSEVGPTIGAELRNKSIVALGLVLACILMFIAFAFRGVSKPVSSWIYGVMAIVGLTFNVIVTCGFFALLGHLTSAHVDTLFVTALLTILGFSIHDTIVVFDRTRENLRINEEKGRKEAFEDVAGRALNQTFVRSINTSVTIAISLAALFVFGPESTRDFALTLLVGIIAGTYSSIFLATPLLVAVEKFRAKK